MKHISPELFDPRDNTIGVISREQLEQDHGLRFQPPSEAFYDALAHPRHIKSGSLRYATYVLNQEADPDNSKPPLVVCLPFEGGAHSERSSKKLSVLASYMARRIITIDMPATGASESPSWLSCWRTSLDSVGETTNDILGQLKEDKEVDFMGICLGGAIAARSAAIRENRAGKLITMTTVGFDTNLLSRTAMQKTGWGAQAKRSLASDTHTRRVVATFDKPHRGRVDLSKLQPIFVNSRKRNLMFGKIGLSLLGRNAALRSLYRDLDPSTELHDFVGTNDGFTDWEEHKTVHDRRQERHPGQSTLTLLEGAGHDWAVIHMTMAAHLAEQALERPENIG